MYFFIPGKYRGNMPGSEESVIVTEQRYPLLVCESDCTGLKASVRNEADDGKRSTDIDSDQQNKIKQQGKKEVIKNG